MKNDNNQTKQIAKWIVGIVSVCILIYLAIKNIGVLAGVFSHTLSLISPLLIGFAIALVLNVPMRFLETFLWPNQKKKWARTLRRVISYIFSLLVILGILVGVVWIVIPELFTAVKILISNCIELLDKAKEMDIPGVNWGELQNKLKGMMQNTFNSLLEQQGGNIMGTAVSTVSIIMNGAIDFVIAIIFSAYILFNKETLKKQCVRLMQAWLPQKWSNWIGHAAAIGSKNLRSFVSGQTLEAVILGTLCMIGMLALRIPYAPMVGVLVGATALIPIVGAFTGAIVGGFIILSEAPDKALVFIIFLLILQQVEGNLIYPKVMGSRVKLPAMWVLAAVTVGGGLGGPIGMLLGVPVASTIYVLLREATEQREQAKKQKKCLDESKQ